MKASFLNKSKENLSNKSKIKSSEMKNEFSGMKIGIIGEKNMVLGFNDLGMDVFAIEKDEDFAEAKDKIVENFAVVFITEAIADKYNLDDLYNRTLPAILIIPGIKRSLEKSSSHLKKILERALGSELNI
jgi:vacuolar-type H+-ATPase subunit F/Vma7